MTEQVEFSVCGQDVTRVINCYWMQLLICQIKGLTMKHSSLIQMESPTTITRNLRNQIIMLCSLQIKLRKLMEAQKLEDLVLKSNMEMKTKGE